MKATRFGMLAVSIVSSGTVFADAFYAGGGVGQSEIDADAGFSSFSDTDVGWKIFGGYMFNKYFAVEGAWVDFGDFSDTVVNPVFLSPARAKLELDGFAISGVASYPVNEAFSVFGKLGVWAWSSDVKIAIVPGFSVDTDDDGTDVMFGAGGSYHFTQAISVRAEWERFTSDGDDADLFSISGVYKF